MVYVYKRHNYLRINHIGSFEKYCVIWGVLSKCYQPRKFMLSKWLELI
nr:MAG TPA_asm: hypothetical protein [Caudoviricetes sp.]